MSADTTTKNLIDELTVSDDFNIGLTGEQIFSQHHISAKKPTETEWFRVYGSNIEELKKGVLCKVKVGIKDEDFIIGGDNKFKKREWWRPLAGSVLLEYAHEYFNFENLKESPYMSFAVDAKQKALNEVPSIVHVDNTCRVQTVSENDNKNYYDLIKYFYEITKVPIVLNTSFNLAGNPIVENIEQLKYTVQNSEFKDIYIPKI